MLKRRKGETREKERERERERELRGEHFLSAKMMHGFFSLFYAAQFGSEGKIVCKKMYLII